MAFFFLGYWHRAIGSKWGALEVLTQYEFIGVCRMGSTWACFDHIPFIRTRNHAPFLLWTPCSPRKFFSKFQKFSQSVLKVSV